MKINHSNAVYTPNGLMLLNYQFSAKCGGTDDR